MNELEMETLKQRKYQAASALIQINPQLREAEAALAILKLTWEHWHHIHEDADRKLAHVDGRRTIITHTSAPAPQSELSVEQMDVDVLENLVSSLQAEIQKRDEGEGR